MTESEALAASTSEVSSPSRNPALSWWSRLAHPASGDRASLARLRRARTPLEALSVRAAVELARRVGAAKSHTPDWRMRAALDLARVLAHVEAHDPRHPMQAAGWKKFAGTRRETEAGEDRPLLSEARFRRLLETGDGEEKVAAFTRLIALMGDRINVQRLADDFLDWNHPIRGDRVREQWAFNYYHAYDAAPPVPPTSTEDDDA